MNLEPLTPANLEEVNTFLQRTQGGKVEPNWSGFLARNDHGVIIGVFHHGTIRISKLHIDPASDPGKTVRLLKFTQDFARVAMPTVVCLCARNSPLLEPCLKMGMKDVTTNTAFLTLGDA